MPERNHEVIIDSYVYPDVVTVTLSNDDFIGSRDYVDKELYESVIEANAAWQDENAKLHELMSEGVEVGRALLRYRDNPPIKHAGPMEGTWYETGEILSIVMDKHEFSSGELLTRLAYLMGVRE